MHSLHFNHLLEDALSKSHTSDEIYSGLKTIKGYTQQILGPKDKPIILLTQKNKKPGPNLLVAAGFHGDEQAGPFGVLQFLTHYVPKINISFLPLVNPVGFDKNKREGRDGRDPNRGFDGSKPVSDEGKILLQYDDLLKDLARDGFLSLHEDNDKTTFHIFAYENSDKPSKFSESLRTFGAGFFGKSATVGALNNGEEGQLKNDQKPTDVVKEQGLVLNVLDGSYEDYMHRSGISFTATTETGGKADFDLRVRANSEIIKHFAGLAYGISKTDMV
jgi:predicted deacylase